MANRVLITFIVFDIVFLCMGCLLLATAIVFEPNGLTENLRGDAALDLLLQSSPLNVVIANAAFVFATFLLSIPAIINARRPMLMRLFTYSVVVCGALTLAVGLDLWYTTLQTHANLASIWSQQPPAAQSRVQDLFSCCGFTNATSPVPFAVDGLCTDPATAQRLGGCATPFAKYANNILDIIFTAMFGIAGVDAIVFFAGLVVIKDRAEKERYRLIDQKVGVGGI